MSFDGLSHSSNDVKVLYGRMVEPKSLTAYEHTCICVECI